MLVSRLDIKKYRWANSKRWLQFRYAQQTNIDPVFAGRLAALGASLGWVITIIRGAVSYEEQAAIATLKLKQNPTWKQMPNGAVYNKKGQCMVAAPGTSPHEQHLAIDGDKRMEAISDYTLAKFGLCRPMFYEPWHIQPIETKGYTYVGRRQFMPTTLHGTLMENQKCRGLVVDDIYGPASHAAFQSDVYP